MIRKEHQHVKALMTSRQASLKEKMYSAMRAIYTSPSPKSPLFLSGQFKRYLSGAKLTPDLVRLKLILGKMQPSSAEAERVFSAAGLYLTKIRARWEIIR